MPAVLALPAFWGAVGAGAAGTAAIVGASEQAGASKSAAQTQADASLKAAQIKAQSDAAALAEQQREKAQDLATQNAIQEANYNQWAAGQGRSSNFAQMLGLPGFNIPAYQPIPNALGTTATTPNAAAGLPSGAPSGNFPTAPSGGSPTDSSAIQSALQANYKALGVSPSGRGSGPTDIAYYADQIAATGGLTPQNFAYWFGPSGRIANDVKGTGAAPTAAAPVANTAASNLTQLGGITPYAPVNVAAPYTPPQANNFGALLG